MEIAFRLGLTEIAEIIKTLGISTDKMYLEGYVEVDKKLYRYIKKGNILSIIDEKGQQLIIGINYKEEQGKDYLNRDILYCKHEISIEYLLPTGEIITLYKEIGLDPGYQSFENVNRHDLLKGLKTRYLSNDEEIASFNIGLDKICMLKSNKIYEFTPEGIHCGNRLITTEGDKLISIGGIETPSIKELKDFNIEEERRKIQKFLNTTPDLHPFTVELILDAYRKLDRKERYAKDVISYYDEDIKEVRQALSTRNNIINTINNCIFYRTIIDSIANKFRQDVLEERATFRP